MAEKRKSYSITFNKGIDKASLPFEGDPARALDGLNYVYRDGKVQKRFGIETIFKAAPTPYRLYEFDGTQTDTYSFNDTRINGMWQFDAEDGNGHLIAHIGRLLYEIEFDDGNLAATPIAVNSAFNTVKDGVSYYPCFEFDNYRSVAVIGNRSLYFFGGNKLMRLRYLANLTRDFSPVEDGADTYVPITTISISCRNAAISGRQSLDQVNLMTQWRKNELLSGVRIDEEAASLESEFGYIYQLDSPIIGKKAGDVEAIRVTIKRRKH